MTPEPATPTIDPEIAEELYESDDGDQVGDWIRVADVEGDARRWMQTHTLVIRDDAGQHYGIRYQRGLTEEQPDEFPWGDRWNKPAEPIAMTRLYPHVVTVVKYRTRPAKEGAR